MHKIIDTSSTVAGSGILPGEAKVGDLDSVVVSHETVPGSQVSVHKVMTLQVLHSWTREQKNA